MKLRNLIIGIIIIIILIFTNVIYKNIHIAKSEMKNTYFNGSAEYTKKKKAKKKKTKKKIKKTKKKKVVKYTNVATANKQTYYNYAQSVGGYDNTQMGCLINLWQRESGWNPNAKNKKSGACGIPQALPCNKIKKQQGSSNWQAQIRWGINYVNYRYGNPCGAWKHFTKKGWY